MNDRPSTPPSTNTAHAEYFPLFDVAGTPVEVGRRYGRLAGDYIRRSIEIYRNAFAQKGVSWERALEVARDFMPQIERFDLGLCAELRAVAEGAELAVENIVAINARTELLYGQKPLAPPGHDDDGDGCTGAVAMPEVTADGRLIHGQNWDWRDECTETAIVLRIEPKDGPRMLTFVEAGLLARCGLNSEGLAVTANFLQNDTGYGAPGIPQPFIRRRILMSRSLGEAMREVFSAPRTCANNLMISHRDGECIDLETTPDEVFWLQPEDGLLVHANHFVSIPARITLRDVEVETNTDSLYRHRRVHAYLEQRRGGLTIEDFKGAFADRFGAPRAVCRSPVSGPGGKTSSTVATIIMDTTLQKMWIAKKPYETCHFKEYSLD